MSRQARRISQTGFYHVMLRGINKQQIFKSYQDNEKFLSILRKYKNNCGYKIYAYCLMGNHVHLLIKPCKENLETIFKKINGSYAIWFNTKYDRVGHLFQDRFKSEPIENERYFLTVLRYIHRNPINANLVENIEEYKYSSYNDYISPRKNSIADTEFVFSITNIDEFIRFNSIDTIEKCIDMAEGKVGVTDEEAKKIIFKITGIENPEKIKFLNSKIERDYFLIQMKEQLPDKQISHLTGISIGLVRKKRKITRRTVPDV